VVKPGVAVGNYVQENHGERQKDENAEITRSTAPCQIFGRGDLRPDRGLPKADMVLLQARPDQRSAFSSFDRPLTSGKYIKQSVINDCARR
jgi:hypothetical protein